MEVRILIKGSNRRDFKRNKIMKRMIISFLTSHSLGASMGQMQNLQFCKCRTLPLWSTYFSYRQTIVKYKLNEFNKLLKRRIAFGLHYSYQTSNAIINFPLTSNFLRSHHNIWWHMYKLLNNTAGAGSRSDGPNIVA